MFIKEDVFTWESIRQFSDNAFSDKYKKYVF